MGNAASSRQSSSTQGLETGTDGVPTDQTIQLNLEDLDLPPRRDKFPGQRGASLESFLSASGNAGGTSGNSSDSRSGPSLTEEIFHGGEPRGERAFQEDGLVGTEPQQLALLAHYAELCKDF